MILSTVADNRSRAFQVAQTITDDLGLEAVVTRVKDPETGGTAVGMYLCGGKKDITVKELTHAVKIWREYL